MLEPLRAERYRLQLTVSDALKQKLELARDLTSHANSAGDLATIVERAVDLLIEKAQRERFAQTPRPRAGGEPRTDRRHVPSAVRRQVIARDGLQCSYVSPEGERCTSRRFLEFHHDHAWAKGGTSDTKNIRIVCRAHNQFFAERDFGKEHVARAAQRRARAQPP